MLKRFACVKGENTFQFSSLSNYGYMDKLSKQVNTSFFCNVYQTARFTSPQCPGAGFHDRLKPHQNSLWQPAFSRLMIFTEVTCFWKTGFYYHWLPSNASTTCTIQCKSLNWGKRLEINSHKSGRRTTGTNLSCPEASQALEKIHSQIGLCK